MGSGKKKDSVIEGGLHFMGLPESWVSKGGICVFTEYWKSNSRGWLAVFGREYE